MLQSFLSFAARIFLIFANRMEKYEVGCTLGVRIL